MRPTHRAASAPSPSEAGAASTTVTGQGDSATAWAARRADSWSTTCPGLVIRTTR
ncbi:hypothetical protein [Geochorda subterranea]|uniref:Uncharacterized protein n=1 Tax=Geochorda subterranea TaxID=3109564 RepID=A0ABZ1BQK7_9FIRM|nr:hypothetical protein [Limnochorda sp. LNt]WRP14856.1 hypothetical protein VLY81_01405 [Limnochorda sp. LNt]